MGNDALLMEGVIAHVMWHFHTFVPRTINHNCTCYTKKYSHEKFFG